MTDRTKGIPRTTWTAGSGMTDRTAGKGRMPDKRYIPTRKEIHKLAVWVMRHPILRDHYALGGGAWLTLRMPRSRVSIDMDAFSFREDISSYRAMMEIIETCKKERVPYRVGRRGEHFCQIVVGYPKPDRDIKVDIGKIWRPLKLETDAKLGCNVLSAEDMAAEKLQCVVDRIEPTDVYDLCRLHETYPAEFRRALKSMSRRGEAGELLVRIQRCFETTEGTGTKERLTAAEQSWMESYVSQMVKDVSKHCKNA